MTTETEIETEIEPVAEAVPGAQAPRTPYGGRRLDPAHYLPERVPPEVARYASALDTLPSGSPGKVGLLELEFARTTRATELVRHYQKSPLQIMRPLYYDPAWPDLPYTYLMSTGAGVMQGDRLRTDLVFGPGAAAHVTTSAYLKVLRMDQDYAVAQLNIDVAEDAYVEYLPDPMIAFGGSRLYQRTRVRLADSATLVLGETLVAGRLARDERHQYTVLVSDLEVSRPDGSVVSIDRVRLTPDTTTGGPAVLGGHDVLAMLYVFTARAPAVEVGDLLHEVLAPTSATGVVHGVSALPGDAGAWVRLLGQDRQAVGRAMDLAWATVRRRLTGRDAPTIRKS